MCVVRIDVENIKSGSVIGITLSNGNYYVLNDEISHNQFSVVGLLTLNGYSFGEKVFDEGIFITG